MEYADKRGRIYLIGINVIPPLSAGPPPPCTGSGDGVGFVAVEPVVEEDELARGVKTP